MRSHAAAFGSCLGLLLLSWLGMQIVHEFGHAAAAWFTGGNVNRVFLHPLSISRTDVNPNPAPAIVVWSGPVTGCLLPWFAAVALDRCRKVQWIQWTIHFCPAIPAFLHFFSGFCLIANGAYLAGGSFEQVGDCGEMLRTGTPAWIICGVGTAAMFAGLCAWHRAGSFSDWYDSPDRSWTESMAITAFLLLIAAIELWLSG